MSPHRGLTGLRTRCGLSDRAASVHRDAVADSNYASAKGKTYEDQNRLLSASVQLTAGERYTGGDLQVGAKNATRDVGALVVFPSYQLHRVYPVLEGDRYSLVVWLRGEDGAGEYWDDAEQSYRDRLAPASGGAEGGEAVDALALAAHNSLGSLYSHLGRAEESLPVYKAALSLAPSDSTTLSNYAAAFMKLNRNEEAVEVYNQALSDDPAVIWSLRGRGGALLRLGRNAEAVADLQTAVEIAPEDAPTQVNLGLALFELGGQHERAIAALTTAVANHGLDGATAVAAHVALAKLHHIKKEPEAGTAAAEMAVTLSQPNVPGRVDALQMRGLLRRTAGDLAGALEDYRVLSAMVPEHTQLAGVVRELEQQVAAGG